MDVKEQVKEHISIADVVSLYVSLKPAGKNLKALCPFHTEKTPSFFVMPDRGTFACYGCNRFGDIFTMVQEMENLSFPEALNFLIDKFHVPVQKNREKRVKRDDYLEINRVARDFFVSHLHEGAEGRKAQEYLRDRGISPATSEAFSLGWAPSGWDHLKRFLQGRKVPEAKAVELGLLVRSEKDRVYDRFRGRLIFPIFSESGAVVAFGGRTLGDETPKYLNSPDTPVYKKGQHLFGFQVAKESIRRQHRAILVEGYMDMIALHQFGVDCAVASLGTAVTEKQIYLLKRFAEEIYIFYDNDAAGQTATLRAIEKMFEENVNPRVLTCPGAKDPDEFIRRQGQKGFQALLPGAPDGFRYALQQAEKRYDLRQPEKKKLAADWVITLVSRFSEPLIRDEYLQMAARFFGVDVALLRTHLGSPVPVRRLPVVEEAPLLLNVGEERFIATLLRCPELAGEVAEIMSEEMLAPLSSRSLIRGLLEHLKADRPVDELARNLTEPERRVFNLIRIKLPAEPLEIDQARQQVAACIDTFCASLNRRRLEEINVEIAVAERENNGVRVEQLMRLKKDFVESITRSKREE